MIRSTIFLLVLVFAFSCKSKNKDDVNPREQYVGTYDVAYTASTLVGTLPFNPNERGNGQVVVSAGNAADELKFDISFPAYTETIMAKLSGGTFVWEKQKDILKVGAGSYDADYSASGEFRGANLIINARAETTTPDGTKIVKTSTFNGIKK
ncbi:hypothetical protein [Tellurirhabdus bombi]|uniref:hypothetical protein n=1 Tax=Tellurirhabdus bombi TaxID=2907205 RepID=UPI001F1EBE1F|nr:hypothetical protein [Tellurirhabdus bombi]